MGSLSKRGPIYTVFTKFPRALEVLLKYLSYFGHKKCAKKVKQTNKINSIRIETLKRVLFPGVKPVTGQD